MRGFLGQGEGVSGSDPSYYDLRYPSRSRMELYPKTRRTRGRLLLWGGIAVLLLALVGVTWWLRRSRERGREMSWASIDFASMPEVELLREFVRIDTTAATGSELVAAKWLAGVLAEHGVEATIESFPGGRANLWAIVEGRSPQALVLLQHLDTTNIEQPEVWTFPPFTGAQDGPWIYGRGVFDMKSLGVAQLLAFLDAARRPQPPARSLILLATGGEEARSSHLGIRWILREHPELVSRFEAVLTEGGILEAIDLETVKYWGIEFAQKQIVWGGACARSKERLEALAGDMRQRLLSSPPERLTPEVAAFLASYGPTRSNSYYQEALANPQALLADIVAYRRLPPYLQSAFRSEAVPFSVEEATGGWRLPIALHLLPHTDFGKARRRLLPPSLTAGTAVHIGPALGADHGSPLDAPVFEAVTGALRQHFPEATVGPYFLPWSHTDCRFVRTAEIPCYGFSPFFILSTDTFTVDGPNEQLGLPGYVRGVELYREVIAEVLGSLPETPSP